MIELSSPSRLFAKVALEISLDKTLDYAIPQELASRVEVGSSVEVTLRGKAHKGVVVAICGQSSFEKVIPIHSVVGSEPLIGKKLMELAIWLSNYYCTPLGLVLKTMVPSVIRENTAAKQQFIVHKNQTYEFFRKEVVHLRETNLPQAKIIETLLEENDKMFLSELLQKAQVSRSPVDSLVKKGWIKLQKVIVDKSPFQNETYFKTFPKTLTKDQAEALRKIIAPLSQETFETHLLFGVTGSGKTEVYLQAIKTALELGKSTIMLVPEISLTPQTIERFKSRFDEELAILHHRLSHGERLDQWNKIKTGKAKIIIGARSAIFAPASNLGLIIVDEEHENSYKQSEEAFHYHARDVAVMRGKLSCAVVVLGSATPSLESYFNSQLGKYKLSLISSRPDRSKMPKVRIIDMRDEYIKAKGFTPFSELLIEGIKQRYVKGEQTILFLNRRGYHTSLVCCGCQEVFKCRHCDLPMTFHYTENQLSCHLCDFTLKPPPQKCPSCQKTDLMKYKGIGTELVERSLKALLPDLRITRIDGDTTKHKGSIEKYFKEFRTGKSDVLIGTQMVAKGLHFPSVTLVAILNSDSGLHIPDFRSSENTFQLITQVSGRAGRGELPGEVLIQTQLPDHEIIQKASKNDFLGFFQEEIKTREEFGFPPFFHLVKLTFISPEEKKAQQAGLDARNYFRKSLSHHYQILPLIASGYAKVKDLFHFQFIIKGKQVLPINKTLKSFLASFSISKVRISIDVDPLSTFF